MASTATARIGISFICPPQYLCAGSAEALQRSRIHICVVLIFSTHAPAEAVSLCAHPGVNRPAGGDYDLTILHNYVTRLFRRAHQVKDARIFREIEVHVDFGAAHVSMGWHRVPDTARMKMRDAHHQLATLRTVEIDVLANRAAIARLHTTQFNWVGLTPANQRCGMAGMRRDRKS